MTTEIEYNSIIEYIKQELRKQIYTIHMATYNDDVVDQATIEGLQVLCTYEEWRKLQKETIPRCNWCGKENPRENHMPCIGYL